MMNTFNCQISGAKNADERLTREFAETGHAQYVGGARFVDFGAKV